MRFFFQSNFEKEGPGVPKDAPQKTGLALFFDILSLQFWQICKLNLIFLVCCIPVVTIGPACAAMTAALLRIVRREPDADVWDDFRVSFRRYWRQGLAYGLVMAAVFGGLGYWALRLVFGGAGLLAAMPFALLLLFSLGAMYVFPLLAGVELPRGALPRNAVLLGVVCLRHSLPAVLLAGGMLVLEFLFFPLSVPVTLVLGLSIPCFITTFAAWCGIRRYILRETETTTEKGE